MKTYFISLKQDTQRRAELAQRFHQNYPEMQWIKAINGKELSAKEYFSYAQQYFNKHQKIITPSEVGCTLSHILALENFLETNEEHCLILEDDILGSDSAIDSIKNILNTNTLDGVLLCGGQIPLGFEKYMLLKNNNMSLVSNFSKKFFFGTCCYVVNRDIAKHIINYHINNFTKADSWDKILGKAINMYYINILQHPFEMNNSHIESEREQFYEPNFWKRILKQGLFWKAFNRIRNDLVRLYLLFIGYQQIHKVKK